MHLAIIYAENLLFYHIQQWLQIGEDQREVPIYNPMESPEIINSAICENDDSSFLQEVIILTEKMQSLTTKSCEMVYLRNQIKFLKRKVYQQHKKNKFLRMICARQRKTINNLKDKTTLLVNKHHLQEKTFISNFWKNEEFITRYVAKIENKPTPTKNGEELRKFAVTALLLAKSIQLR
jgi:hypothetical protein